ncbi:MAG: aspartate/glutamate racemase family protein, partial [Clostridia bacterium]|nr:aspartate/glutamate racemase family protein [Clostridia bacterium]
TVLADCQPYLKKEILYYYGDNKHAPYGNLPKAKIRKYVLRAFKRFKRLKVRAVVIACNTATAVCIEELRHRFSFPIIGAEPAVFPACVKGGEVFVLATRATCQSERLVRLCRRAERVYPNCTVRIAPCDLLAGEIEGNLQNPDYDYKRFLPRGKPSAVVLGCTHYIYIKERIEKHYGCEAFDGNEGIAKRLCSVLNEKNRDGRPPFQKRKTFLGFLTTKKPQIPKNGGSERKPNKRSLKNAKKRAKNGHMQSLFFLGKQRKNNKNTYEQMFAV